MPITGVILAGGRGLRMAGRDKGLINYQGRPLIEHSLKVLTPQVDEIVISANRNIERYREYGYPVIIDQQPDYSGPLAGVQAGLAHAKHHLVVFTPCDTPRLSENYVTRLREALEQYGCLAVYVTAADQEHPTHVLLKRECAHTLTTYLNSGQRTVKNWLSLIEARQVDFSDILESLININLPTDLV